MNRDSGSEGGNESLNLESLVRDLVRTVPLITDQINRIVERINDLNVNDATLKSTLELELKSLRSVIQNFERFLLYGDGNNEPVSTRLTRLDEKQRSNSQDLAELKVLISQLSVRIDALSQTLDNSLKKVATNPNGVTIKTGIDFSDNRTKVILAAIVTLPTILSTIFNTFFTETRTREVEQTVREEIEQGEEIVPYLFPETGVDENP